MAPPILQRSADAAEIDEGEAEMVEVFANHVAGANLVPLSA
jgi:hypothetical protein